MSNERYMIVSSDCHAGLPCESYRPYLESAFHLQFEEFLAERHANRDAAMKLNYDYIHEWETTNEEGLKGAYEGPRRDKEMDADGVAGEVMFADADAVTGMESPPFGAGLSAGAIKDPALAFAGARAHNRFLEDLCADNPVRRAGVALIPVTHDIDLAVREVDAVAGKPGIRGVMIPTKKMAALLKGKISKLPSEYFGTNIFIGASTMSREEIRRRHVIGCDVAMWGTDYPHPEGTWPNTVAKLRSDFHDVPVEDTRKLLGDTAAALYGMDVPALRAIADKIGPTPQDLGQDVTLRTNPDDVANARWWIKEYGCKAPNA